MVKRFFLGFESNRFYLNERGVSELFSKDNSFVELIDYLDKKKIIKVLDKVSRKYSSRNVELITNLDYWFPTIESFVYSKKRVKTGDGVVEVYSHFKHLKLIQRLYALPRSYDGEWILSLFGELRPKHSEEPIEFITINSQNDISLVDLVELAEVVSVKEPYSKRNLEIGVPVSDNSVIKKTNNYLKRENFNISYVFSRF
jgi:hypothetical protein